MMAKSNPVGVVGELWRYPVQSMRGERLGAVAAGPSGLCGDRAYAIVDPATDTAVTAGGGRRQWRPLITWSARFVSPPAFGAPSPAVEIALPEGGRIASDDPEAEARLSAALGAELRLAPSSAAKPAYALAPLHLLTTATLRQFQAYYPEGRFEAARFRPNIVIDSGPTVGFIETEWISRTLAVGPTLRLRVADHCRRCAMTVLPQGDLPRDPAILHHVRTWNATRAGIYAQVIEPGEIREGDPVVLLE